MERFRKVHYGTCAMEFYAIMNKYMNKLIGNKVNKTYSLLSFFSTYNPKLHVDVHTAKLRLRG